MTTPTAITLEEYLQNPTEPECEYIDGELFQKAMGTNPHSALQGRLNYLLYKFHLSGLCQIRPELSLRVRKTAILIPDLCLIAPDNREPGVVTQTALLCIEILSPSDRFSQTVRKCEEYLNWGVPACWIFDPEKQTAWVMNRNGVHEVPPAGTLEAGPFSLPLSDVFPNV